MLSKDLLKVHRLASESVFHKKTFFRIREWTYGSLRVEEQFGICQMGYI
jgi:hypothetical protein